MSVYRVKCATATAVALCLSRVGSALCGVNFRPSVRCARKGIQEATIERAQTEMAKVRNESSGRVAGDHGIGDTQCANSAERGNVFQA